MPCIAVVRMFNDWTKRSRLIGQPDPVSAPVLRILLSDDIPFLRRRSKGARNGRFLYIQLFGQMRLEKYGWNCSKIVLSSGGRVNIRSPLGGVFALVSSAFSPPNG
jgi:hypothetical protein